jgi:O-antigen/teichoic acid export membrane protein
VSISVFQWLKKNITLLFNAGSLLGTTLVTSGLGFIYWWAAARLFPVESVGVSSAAISAMTLIGNICLLGFSTLLLTEIPRQRDQAPALISTALLIVGSAGFVVGLGSALLFPFLSPELGSLSDNFVNILIFAAGVGLTSMSLVLDQAFIGLLRGELQLWRNSVFSIVKLVLLVLFGFLALQKAGMLIYLSWTLGSVLSVLSLSRSMKSRPSLRSFLPQWHLVRKLGLPALRHHLLNMALQAPTLVLPVLVTALLSAKMNAWFYVSWMLASFVFMVPYALTTVLHTTNSTRPQAVGQKMLVTMSLAAAIALMANLVIQAAPQFILGIFGHSYADKASWCLRILALAAFPLIIKNHYISICRVQDRLTGAMLGMVPFGLLELALAAVGAHFLGLTGLSLGWLCALCCENIYMFPTIFRALRLARTSTEALPEVEEDEMEPIWLIDTALMPVIGTRYTELETTRKHYTGKMLALKKQMTASELPTVQQEHLSGSSAAHGLKRTQLERYISFHGETHLHGEADPRSTITLPLLNLPARSPSSGEPQDRDRSETGATPSIPSPFRHFSSGAQDLEADSSEHTLPRLLSLRERAGRLAEEAPADLSARHPISQKGTKTTPAMPLEADLSKPPADLSADALYEAAHKPWNLEADLSKPPADLSADALPETVHSKNQ